MKQPIILSIGVSQILIDIKEDITAYESAIYAELLAKIVSSAPDEQVFQLLMIIERHIHEDYNLNVFIADYIDHVESEEEDAKKNFFKNMFKN